MPNLTKPKVKTIHVSGTRKKAVARATLRPGTGLVRINSKRLDLYEPKMARLKLTEPLILSGEFADKVDIDINIFGGGFMSQAEAARLAMAKALVEFSNGKLKKQFLDYDRTLLVADVRQRETRKPNCAGSARSKVQKSYR